MYIGNYSKINISILFIKKLAGLIYFYLKKAHWFYQKYHEITSVPKERYETKNFGDH